jgi:alpha-1,6-mannosyltransferase
MFWSASGGGVRRYLERKEEWFASRADLFRHLLVVPGARDSFSDSPPLSRALVRSPRIPFSPGYRAPVSCRGILRVLGSWKPDLAEAGCPFKFRRALSIWAAGSGKPVFDYYHAFFPVSYTQALFGNRDTALRRALERAGWAFLRSVYADSSRIFVASPVIRDVLALHGITNTEIAPLGVDTGIFRPGGGRRGSVILFVGRLTREKGLETVLETFRIVSGRRPSRLVIVGDGIQRPRVEELASGSQGITYRSFMEQGELAGIYREADVLLSAAPAETLGLTFLEALSSGIPVVGLSGSGLMDSFPREIAAAVSPGTPENLAGAVEGFLDHPPDPDVCRRYAESYSWPGRLAAIVSRELEIAGMDVPQGLRG